ncbi:MAG: M12 family metallo-peptidase [Ilumatobacter fluminis]|uniref:reprolysin-like metallopeptidase n=1 Tax=Ilumatobacter fluminis TaxID=467091 RepID=UPI0032EEEAA2
MNKLSRRVCALLGTAAALVVGSIVPAAGAAATGESNHFTDVPAVADPSGEVESIAADAVRSRTVHIDVDGLLTDLATGSVTFDLFDDVSISFTGVGRGAGVDGGSTWSATGESSTFSLTIDDGVRGTWMSGATVYSVRPAGGGAHLVAEHSNESAGRVEHQEPDPDDRPVALSDERIAEALAQRPSGEQSPRSAQADGSAVVRVLTVYTTPARTWYGGAANAEAAIAAMVNDTNTILSNSGVDVQVESAGIQHVAHNDLATTSADLQALTFADTAALDDVHFERFLTDADVVMMVRSPAGSVCGTAWGLPQARSGWDDDYAFGVIDTVCAPAPEYGYAHEFGHLFGADHGYGNGVGAYSYSTGYRAPVGNPGGRYRTVMAYEDGPDCECPVIPYFSSPRSINGIGSIGSASQDNTRTMNNTAARVAAYRPLPYLTFGPDRLLETRSGPDNLTTDGEFQGQGVRAAGSTLQLQVSGRSLVIDSDEAVLLNVTAINPSAAGHITVWPCNEQQPTASNLNYTPGGVVANTVLAKLDNRGRVCIYTHAQVHLVVDVSAAVPNDSSLRPVVPARLLETRSGPAFRTSDGQNQGGGVRPAGSVAKIKVAGRGGVPQTATAAMLNVTAVNPSAAGHITVWPCDQRQPTASSLNAGPGQVVPNAVLAKLDPQGNICIYTHARMHLLVDVAGAVTNGSPLVSIQPARVLETRSGAGNTTVDGYYRNTGPIGPNQWGRLPLIHEVGGDYVGRGGVDTGARSAIVNITAVNPESAGHITAFDCAFEIPNASNLNYAPGQVVANMAIVTLSYDSDAVDEGFCIASRGRTHLLVDVVAWL